MPCIMLDKIEQLAKEKAFDRLSNAEKALVLSMMPREEYDQIRRMLQMAESMDASVVAPERLRARVMTQFPKPEGVRVSIWLALGMLAIGWGAMWLFRPVEIQEKWVPIVQQKTDTVWVERIKWREKVVYKTRMVPVSSPLPKSIALQPDPVNIIPAAPLYLPESGMQQAIGTSLGDTPELMSFFTQGDQGK